MLPLLKSGNIIRQMRRKCTKLLVENQSLRLGVYLSHTESTNLIPKEASNADI